MTRKAMIAILVMSVVGNCASAVAYSWIELPYDRKLMLRERGFVTKVLAGREVLDSKEKESRFDNFFKKGLFSEMTQESVLSVLPEKRREFFVRYVRSAKDPAALARLNGLALRIVPVLVRGVTRNGKHTDFHPAVRYTAILILGELDRQLGVSLGEKKKPKPLTAALPILFGFHQAKGSTDAVRLGALVGIARHARLGVIDDPNGQRGGLLLAQLKQPLPESRDPAAHDWMRRLAVQILGDMSQSGGNQEIVAALVGLVGDKNTPMSLRCAAAETFGKLKIQPTAKLDPAALASGLAGLAVDACVYEQVVVAQLEQLPSRRRLAHHLTSVRGGIKPSKKHVAAPQQAMLTRIDELMTKYIREMDRSSFTDEQLLAKLDSISSEMKSATDDGSAAPPADAPATPPVDSSDPKKDESSTPFDPFGDWNHRLRIVAATA